MSSDVIDTARKKIFDPTTMNMTQLLAVYCSVYIVDTVLLNSYSAFGMPVSTTACLVFELLGAALAITLFHHMPTGEVINWSKAGTVVSAIILSIFITGFAAFLIQRAVRAAIRHKSEDLLTLILHGGWIGGGVLTAMIYFMILKGMKNIPIVKEFKAFLDAYTYRHIAFVILTWGLSAILIHMLLVIFREKAAKRLFPVLTIMGMMCMAFAFGQNDLANCASPGLATLQVVKTYTQTTSQNDSSDSQPASAMSPEDIAARNAERQKSVKVATKMPIDKKWLFFCGLMMAMGMFTKNAKRVTAAAVRAGSSSDHVKLWAPRWCIGMAQYMLKFRGEIPALSPAAEKTPEGKTAHYDPLRACVIMAVAASVIATASSQGLPVSTTYVAFAAIVATAMADRIYQRGDAALKLGRSIWVVFSWFMAAAIAIVATGAICLTVYKLGVLGMMICIGINLTIRIYLKKRSDRQEERIREEARERMNPEEYALEDE